MPNASTDDPQGLDPPQRESTKSGVVPDAPHPRRMSRRPRQFRPDLAALAPLRVAAVADLVAAGWTPSTIARRVQLGWWQRRARGVILLQSGPPTRRQIVEAALIYARPDGVITGVEALRRHGMRRLPDTDEVHVLIGEARRRPSSEPFVLERSVRLPEPVVRDGVPVAPLDRALMDAARLTPDRDAVRAMIAEAIQARRTTLARLSAELGTGNQRWSSIPRQVLCEADEGMRSATEGWALDVHQASDLPPILWNPRLYLPNGRFLGSPDGFFRDVGLAWEINSLEFHPEGDDHTARRTADLVGAGILVVGHRPGRLKTEPERVIQEVWNYYLLAASRPPPDIRVVPAPRRQDAA
jgi:hypothetical protein